MTRRTSVVVAVIASASLLAACGGSVPSPTPGSNAATPVPAGGGSAAPASGGTLTIGIGGYPPTFNYNLNGSAPGYSIYRAIQEHLTGATTDGTGLRPELAESWTLIDDTTWQFKLRHGVTWHDGTPFTADDVVATIDIVLNGKPESYYRTRIADATGAEKVDDFTVNIKTKQKSAILPVGLADIYIYQAKQIRDGGNEAISAHPVGTGQFKLAGSEEGVSVTLERYDGYWGEKAHLDKVVFRAIPEDATRLAALERGEIDIAYNVPPDDAPRLEGSSDITVVSSPIGQIMNVNFSLNSDVIPADSPLRNVKVRQALNYGVDKESIVENLLQGFTKVAPGQVIAADGLGHNPAIEAYPYDPEKAKQLLAEAGYPDGFEFVLTTAQGRYVKQLEIPQAIAGQLEAVGVKVDLDVRDWSAIESELGGGLPAYYAGWNYF
ncbi:MAG: hypothetical protein IT386_17160, partial [Deltaproteobacteria bacterium]|nr:hypothetical protein [Deltaproteobacteria bacterium]